MTALAFDLRDSGAAAPASQRQLFVVSCAAHEPVAGTLDALLAGAFCAVGAGAATGCPVCAGSLEPRWTAGSGAHGGRCADCGSTLS